MSRSRPSSCKPPRPVRGFSMIEIMISLVIASMAILAVMAVYGNSRESYTAQDAVARMQENQRIGNAILERTLRIGNHRQYPMPRDMNPMLVAFQPIAGEEGSSTAAGQSDSVEIGFNGSTNPLTATADGLIVDCLGAAVASATESRNRFKVEVDAENRPWLACSNDGGSNWTPLIPDVQAMEVLYGQFTSENRSVTSYVPWSAVTDPNKIVAVRIFLLYRSTAEVAPTASTQTWTLAEQTYGPYSDRFLRSLSELTIVIRSVAL